MIEFGRVTAVTGHYGSGKTNLTVNLAVDHARAGERVTVVDLDLVNPYFRTADHSEIFKAHGIKLIAPNYANTNLDIPSIGIDMAAAADGCDRLFIDVGGDDAGAAALGQYSRVLNELDCALYYVVNFYRLLTSAPDETVELLRDIERASRIRARGMINCSNLGMQTTAADVAATAAAAEQCAELAGIPLVMTAAERSLRIEGAYPMDVFVRPFWEE